MSAAITIGATVRHPSRGTGQVVTLVYSPLRPAVAIKAWVEFTHVGFGNCTQRFCCFCDDLVIVPPLPGPKPTLTVVPAEHPLVVA